MMPYEGLSETVLTSGSRAGVILIKPFSTERVWLPRYRGKGM